jgi:hypothetical protein
MRVESLVHGLGEEKNPKGTVLEVSEEAGKQLIEKGFAKKTTKKAD